MTESNQLLKIEFYVPESHLETVKSAMFSAGAGKAGLYDSCAWQTAGEGQFRPLPGSRPFLGEQDKLETVVELLLDPLSLIKFLLAKLSLEYLHKLLERPDVISRLFL